MINKQSPSAGNPTLIKGKVFSMDAVLLLIVSALIVVGIVMVYSSSWGTAIILDGDTSVVLIRQLRWLAVGILGAFIISRIDYHRFQPLLVPMIFITISLLLAVLLFGEERYEATRSFTNGAGQPSEFAKLAVIIYLAFWLFNKRERINNIFFGLLPLSIILGVICTLIGFQPDISAVLTILLLGSIMFFLIGADFRQIISVIMLVVIAGAILILATGRGRDRINQYVNGLNDPLGSSYHIQQSVEAIGRGKTLGLGIGEGTTKYYLPTSWTDSIFAVIVEETGLVGAGTIILLYLLLLWRGLYIARNAPDELGKLLAAGITIWITLEAMINMGVLVKILPFAGNALPLISSGGSSLVSCLLGLGILMGVGRTTYKMQEISDQSRRYSGAVVDLRWRNGGRSVSRSRSSSSAEN